MRIGLDTETHPLTRGRGVGRVVCASLAWRGDLPICLPEGARVGPGPGGTMVALLDRRGAREVWASQLAAPAGGVEWVAHNAAFEVLGLAELVGGTALDVSLELLDAQRPAAAVPWMTCTWIRERLIAIAHGDLQGASKDHFALAGCVQRYLGVDISEGKGKAAKCSACGGSGLRGGACTVCLGFGWVGPWRLRYHQLDGVPLVDWPDEAAEYAALDAAYALLVAEAQDEAAPTPAGPVVWGGRVVDEGPQLAAAVAFDLAAAWGVCIDAPRSEALGTVVEATQARAAALGVEVGFIRGADGVAAAAPAEKRGRPGSTSKKALGELVARCFGPVAKLTPTGQVVTDRDTLLASGDPLLRRYAEMGEELTLAKTYLPTLREGVALGPVGGRPGAPAGPMTSRPNALVATGRASWRDPNWTNPPREGGFRECVVPRPGCVFVAADYAAIEFRALGQICLWEGFGRTIVDAFIAGIDPHSDFAARLRGVPYVDFCALVTAGDTQAKRERDIAKGVNYGLPGGLGAERLVDHLAHNGVELHPDRGEAIEEAWRLKRAFPAQWPEMGPYFDLHARLTADGQRFTLAQYVSCRLRGGVGYTDGCNGRFQGLAADGAKAAFFRATRSAVSGRGPLAGARPVLYLHDEIIVEVPCGDGVWAPMDRDHLSDAGARLEEIMVSEMARYLPDVPIEAEPAAMLRWRKGPKTVRDTRGRLVPCDLEGA